jgi:hypothetical protein
MQWQSGSSSTIWGPGRALPVNPNERKYRAWSGVSASGHIRTLPRRDAPGCAEARHLRRSRGIVQRSLKLRIVVALHIRHKTLHAVCVGAYRKTNKVVRTD